MSRVDPPPVPRPAIRPLDPRAVDRIAAGEVVERPASAVKELVENALDAGATRIEIAIADGGRTLIRVADDGCGIPAGELALALARHATSKTDGADLLDIRTFGFRGEALASLAAVARLSLTSRVAGGEGATIAVEAGRVGPPRPAAITRGTVVEVHDLFFATPARLKFLRGDRAEAQSVADAVRRLAMAEPYVAFVLRDLTDGADRLVFRVEGERGDARDALLARLGAVMGRDFAEESVALDEEAQGHHLTGQAGLPGAARGAAVAQHVFVNGRPVRDKLLAGALRGAYADLLARGRHPSAAIFLDCEPHLVDVNVHPAKAEVRFREAALVRSLVVGGIRRALGREGPRPVRALSGGLAGAFAPSVEAPYVVIERHVLPGFAEAPPPAWPSPSARDPDAPASPPPAHPLGQARAHLHGNWILAETADGLVLVDQHAAHERLVYERLKAEALAGPVPAQALLVPEIVAMPEAEAGRLLAAAVGLARLGLEVEAFGPGVVAVRTVPAALGPAAAGPLLREVAAALACEASDDAAGAETLARRLDAVLSRMACHGSVRSGRRLRPEEMDALLRAMETTPNSGTCNHGRPTFVSLDLAAIERLFGRR